MAPVSLLDRSLSHTQGDSVQLLQLAAFLAPEPIPLHLFTEHVELLAEPLRNTAGDPDVLDDTVGLIVGYSLARRQTDRIQLHRLVQAAIRHRLPPAEQQLEQERVLALLTAAHPPGDPQDPASWSAYGELAPHVLATGPLGDDRADTRQLILDTTRYLEAKGDSQASRAVAEQLLDRWRRTLGRDHLDTLTAAKALVIALVRLGELAPARALGQDTVERGRRMLGPDHPTTLHAASFLTLALARLGELASARALGQETLDRCQRALGPDHPSALLAAPVLTLALVELGELAPARALGQDTVERGRRVLGPDHPITLQAAAVLTGSSKLTGQDPLAG